ncbi:MAG: uroporphyrinogen decarboxylase family protein, partial [Fimbriimonadaceae bacterium]
MSNEPMAVSPRELVLKTLEFRHPSRAPRDMWTLPATFTKFPGAIESIQAEFPLDIDYQLGYEPKAAPEKGDPYAVGESTDAWGCVFKNVQAGIIGEVKEPPVEEWAEDVEKVHMPVEWLEIDRDRVNRECAESDKFKIAGGCPRPFEQLQFIRGTEDLMMDLLDPEPEQIEFMHRMHEFYVKLQTVWAETEVDALRFIDDWGSQLGLLISPELWREHFKPMYAEYGRIARRHGKKLFMHSDGDIRSILPELIEIGVDAVNCQVGLMTPAALEPFAGKITFWGEVDR